MISMGSKGALLSCDEGDIIACPPAVEVVNTVGCGDSMLGAFAVAVIRAMSAEESIRYAVAVGTANALSPSTGSFDIKEMFHSIFFNKANLVILEDPIIISIESLYSNR